MPCQITQRADISSLKLRTCRCHLATRRTGGRSSTMERGRISNTSFDLCKLAGSIYRILSMGLQDAYGIRRAGNTTRKVQWSAGKKEAPLVQSFANLCKLVEVK